MLGGAAFRRLRRRTPPPPLAPSPGDGDTGLGAPCLGRAMEDYFALNATKLGLGIPLDNRFIALDNGIGFSYTTDASFVGHAYAKAIKQVRLGLGLGLGLGLANPNPSPNLTLPA